MRTEQLKTYKPKVLPFGEDLGGAFLQAAIADTLLTTTQLDSLRSIAQLCPYTYGTAVYSARALVNYYDAINTHYVNECERTTTQQAQNRSIFTELSDESVVTQNLNLIPNPANNEVSIEFLSINEDKVRTKEQLEQLEIIDVSGRVLKSYNSKQIENTINLSGFSTGVYFVKATNKQGITATQKLFISKNN